MTDPGNYLPSIDGITLTWVEETDILVTWNHSNDLDVKGYQVHINSEDFMDISDATFVGETRTANSFVISANVFSDLVNTTDWFISVTTFDDNQIRTSVDAKKITSVDATNQVTEDSNAENDLESLLTTPNLIAAGLVLVSLLLLLAIVRGRGNKTQKEKNGKSKQLHGASTMTRGTAPHNPTFHLLLQQRRYKLNLCSALLRELRHRTSAENNMPHLDLL